MGFADDLHYGLSNLQTSILCPICDFSCKTGKFIVYQKALVHHNCNGVLPQLETPISKWNHIGVSRELCIYVTLHQIYFACNSITVAVLLYIHSNFMKTS